MLSELNRVVHCTATWQESMLLPASLLHETVLGWLISCDFFWCLPADLQAHKFTSTGQHSTKWRNSGINLRRNHSKSSSEETSELIRLSLSSCRRMLTKISKLNAFPKRIKKMKLSFKMCATIWGNKIEIACSFFPNWWLMICLTVKSRKLIKYQLSISINNPIIVLYVDVDIYTR